MTDAFVDAFKSLRRQHRHAVSVRAIGRASQAAHRQGRQVVHMLHVGKTGGTAVQMALHNVPKPADLQLQMYGHGISLSDIPPNDDIFLFLREPLARFASGFEMRRREGRPRHYRPWTPAERRAFSRFDTPESL